MRIACLLFMLALSFVPVSAEEGTPPPAPIDASCETAEQCFRNALAPDATAVSADERLARKLERLRRLTERHAGSLWARRANLVMGVLLIERQPAEALLFLRAAQRDFPLLEDYVRLWIGEALLKSGDVFASASLLDIIPNIVPDTLLGSRIAYRAGEAWFRVGQCGYAMEPLSRGAAQEPQDAGASRALLMLAECQAQDNRSPDSSVTLRQIWMRYPQTLEAGEAEKRLSQRLNGQTWKPTADERYVRASAFAAAAFNEEAVEELKAFLSSASGHPKREEAKLRLAMALARLKRYDQAKLIFHELASSGPSTEANEAAVWLARSYLRLGEGDRLVSLRQVYPKLTLTPEQQALILIVQGTWFDDQNQSDQAIAQYRQIVQFGDRTEQRAEALWRIGWIQYRTGQYSETARTLQDLVAIREDPANNPQALYWTARAQERLQDAKAAEGYQALCRKYAWTYYCQLTRTRVDVPLPDPAGGAPDSESGEDSRSGIAQDVHYRRAVELRTLGLEQEAGREVAWLLDRYARNRAALVELITRVSEAGGYHQGLRLARLHFRDGLERGLEPVQPSLWSVAYPTVYLPTIRALSSARLDPYLAAAIIREESQYDARAVSRVGAIGLMQLMPSTAQAVAQRNGSTVARDDLFDQETNIRYGVRYLEQLLGQFNGNLVHAVAAYNAGPPVVTGWIQKFGDREPDEFVESIPYQETRQYVRRVLRSYREYRRLGGEACVVRSLDKAC
ncbi:MAG: tetratricopeptide repeat protein [Nitrospiraceae bacterium]|nr:tetratricopeptide repeat protein [Nitrospiraceae bacterium]